MKIVIIYKSSEFTGA